jgi:hypothetical protein
VVHAIDLRRIHEALHVFSQTKYRWAPFGRITANAFKDAGAIMQNVRHHMHSGIGPLDKLAIVPHNVANARAYHIFGFAVF